METMIENNVAYKEQVTQQEIPYYRIVGNEVQVFEHAYKNQLPLLLKGPTGSGKSRLVEFMAYKLNTELITVSCNEETSSVDLIGRYIVRGAETVWQDGPLTRAARAGCIVYIDEIAEARPDTIVALHSLTDHRRMLFLDRHNEAISVAPSFMLVASFNPGYQKGWKELKPSTRQRFVGVTMNYPAADVEAEIICAESGTEKNVANKLVQVGSKIRNLVELGLAESASTRLLVDAAKLIHSGLPARLACKVGIIEPLTDDADTAKALEDLIALMI